MYYSLHKSSKKAHVSTEQVQSLSYKVNKCNSFFTFKLDPEIYYIKHCRTSPCIEDPVYVKASYFSTSRLQLIESKYKPN